MQWLLTGGEVGVILCIMLTKEEAATKLGMSPRTIDHWFATGRLTPAAERGYYNAVLIEDAEIERAREQRAAELVDDLERLGYNVAITRK